MPRLSGSASKSDQNVSRETFLSDSGTAKVGHEGGFCEGFRMLALDRGMFPRPEAAGFRKPPKEETAARKMLDVAGAVYGALWSARHGAWT
jgi:hypothetical protein